MKKLYRFCKILIALVVLLMAKNSDVAAANEVTIYMDTVSVAVGQQVVVNIKATDFIMMLAAQGTVGFDTSELHFVDVEQFGMSSLNSSNFGTNGAANGYITFSWTDQTLVGTTLANESEFFAIRFSVTATACQNTAVVFLNSPTLIQFVDTSLNQIPDTLYPGMVIPTGLSITASVTPVNPSSCTGQNVTLTASSGATYSWSTSATTNAITVNPIGTTVYKVTVTNANGCSAVAVDTINVGTSVAPTVSVNASQVNICTGTNVIFTATPTNGGAVPAYQWKKNGSNVGTNSATYSNNSLNNNDSVWVVLTSSSTCASPDSAVSNITHITISATVVPSVSVGASQTTICANTGVTFTAIPIHGGLTPDYQWIKNGNNVGSNSATYIDNGLNNNDSVWVVLTSSLSCASPATATSAKTKMTVNPVPSAPGAGSNSPVASGGIITLTAGNINSATYQWSGPNGYSSNQQNPTIANAATINSGTYQVIAIVNGCNSLASTVSVTVNNPVRAFVLYMDTATAVVGQQVVVQVKASDFIMMLSAQGTVGFDTSGLHFVDVEQFGLSTLNTSNFGVSAAANGYITFSWTDQTLVGTTLANDSEFFAMRFIIAANACRNTAVSFLNSPATLEFVDTSFNPIAFTLHPGMVMPTGGGITASISPVNPSICNGQNVTLTASAGSTFSWSTSATTDSIHASPAITTIYIVTVTNATGCSAQASDTINVTTGVPPTVSVNASQTNICTGANVIFTATPVNAGVTPGYQWKWNGNNVGTNSANYSNNLLSNNDSVWVVITSGVTCASPDTAPSNVTYITISPAVVPSVTANASQTTICANTGVTFTATPINGGLAPVYQWVKNGNNVANGATYTDNLLNNSDQVWIVLTSSANCAAPLTANSDTIEMTVNSSVTPTITASASQTTICADSIVIFTAASSNGGLTPVYQWVKNGNNVGSNSLVYSDNGLNNNDAVWVVLTSDALCASPETLTSDTVNITVNQTVVPTISVNASQTTICAGTSVTFTATTINGGVAPTFRWKKNGNTVGGDSATYTDNALNNNDSVWAVMVSSASCASPAKVISNLIYITSGTNLLPLVSVGASQTTICAGTAVTFTATPTNGGPSPTYQWIKNGNNVGTDSAVYTDNNLSNNDSVWVVLTSSLSCASPATATGAVTHITVSANIVPLVNVTASQTTICAGTNVIFTASPTNGGVAPVYKWKKNGNTVGTNSNTYSDNTLNNNDSVWVVLTSTAACASPAIVRSSTIIITLSTGVTPTVSIVSSQTTICTGSNVQFTATPTNGGVTPIYQWKKNGNNVGTNSATHSDNTLSNNDSVWVVLTSGASCASPATATSNIINIIVSTSVLPSVSVTANPATICTGITVTFTATPTNGGITPTYQWEKNGSNVGSNNAIYGDNTLSTGDSVWVVLTSSAGCASPTTEVSNKVRVTVNPIPATPVAGSNSPVTAGGTIALTSTTIAGATYEWGGPNSYSSAQQDPNIPNATIAMNGTYQVIATANGCNSQAATVAVTVNAAATNVVLYMDTVSGVANQQVVVDVKARDFVEMLSAQGTVGFDATKLTFVDVEHFGLNSLTALDFGTTNALSGYITFAWSGLTGNTLDNDSEFFAIRFKIDSGTCQSTAVTFLNSPTTFEFVDTTLNPLNNTTLPGMVNATFVADSVVTAVGQTTFCQGGSVSLLANGGYTYLWSNQATAQSITVNANGNYQVTVTNGNNCSAVSSTTTVTVNANPSAAVTTVGQTTFCAGDSITLSAAAGLTYAWSSNAITQSIKATTNGNYGVTVTNSNNCSAVSVPVTVVVNPLPSVSFTLPVDTICLHASAMTLTGGSPTGGTYSGTGVSTGAFNPATAGQGVFNITYIYTNNNSCSNTATASISVNICEGIDVITAYNWNVYPNPANNNLTIGMDADLLPVAYMIYDVLGNKIADGNITSDKYLLNTSNYASGLYYLKIYHGQEVNVKSFVVIK